MRQPFKTSDYSHTIVEVLNIAADGGVGTYRFAVAWPREQPHGRGPVNLAGIGFYDRLVDELLAKSIGPW